jgi:uncharacterized protein DUF3854
VGGGRMEKPPTEISAEVYGQALRSQLRSEPRGYLSKGHRRMLFEVSGVDPEVARERGTFTARRGKDVPQEHGQLPRKPGVVFPVHTLDGRIFYRLRPDKPGRGPKYMQPTGHPNRLDVHPRQHERIMRPGGIRYITEGEKKTDAGVSHDLLMVGLSGVWNGQKDKALIPDWHELPLEGERYSICFDSDIATNPNVQMAADRLARLLQEQGAKVFITLLPPASDGSKQGLDDFFANDGTVEALEMLTRPFDLANVEAARLSRDEKLRAAISDLERRFWETEWKGMGGASARDVALKLIEAARRHGKVVDDGIRVEKAQGPLALEAKISGRTLWKCLNRLEDWGFCYRDNEGRKADKSGAFVLRANVSQYGEKRIREGRGEQLETNSVPGDLHLRAPRLRWSSPAHNPQRGTVGGTRMVRQSSKPKPRSAVERLGKIRGSILDVLDVAGGMATLEDIAYALHRSRPRDLRRRNLPMLEEVGILSIEGDVVTLADNWLAILEEQRELGKEIEADNLSRLRYGDKSRAYHNRRRIKPNRHHANVGADGHVEDLVRAGESKTSKSESIALSQLAVAIRDYLKRNPRDACQPTGWIGSTLWAYGLYPGKPTPQETRSAIDELGGMRYLQNALEASRAVA